MATPFLATDAMDRTRAFLNDANIDLFDNATQLPYLKIANDEFSDRLLSVGISIQKVVSAIIPFPQGTFEVPLPDDIISPIQLFEKSPNENDDKFVMMHQRSFEPNQTPGANLSLWAWRDQTIFTPGSIMDKALRLRYNRVITVISGEATPLEVVGSLNYLACKNAALLAKHVGQNSIKAMELDTDADKYLSLLLGIKVKDNQGIPTRRLAFRGSRYSRRLR